MANCPKCGRALGFLDVRAECPSCGVNIPNYNWEARLEEDAANAEIAWSKFRRFTGNFKSAVFGKKIRIVRFVCTFLPLVALVLPAVTVLLNIPLIDTGKANISMLSFVLNYFSSINIGSLSGLFGEAHIGTSVLMLAAAIALLFLAVVFGVLNFVFVLVDAFKLKAKKNIVLCVLSDLCFIIAAVLFGIAFSGFSASSVNLLSGSVSYGIFVGIALFSLNVALNVIISKQFKAERQKN